MPSIWLSVTKKGVKTKYRKPQNQFFGVPQPHAAFTGILIGAIVIIALVLFISNNWVIAIASFMYGLFVLTPGAYAIKFWRKIREAIGG